MNLILGDCLQKLKELKENSVDAVVTDPPYELGFMGKSWDNTGIANNVSLWKEVLRVLMPGGHLLSFGGSRTYHRMACAIEDAGFEIRDQIQYVYGSGFPKSANLYKMMEKKYRSTTKTKYCLHNLPEADLSETPSIKGGEGEILRPRLSEQGLPKQREDSQPIQFSQRGCQSCLERRGDLETNSRELSRCKVCEMSERVSCYGTERWLCNGTPFGYGTESWQATTENRSCPSYRPRPEEQSDRKLNAVPDQPSPQEIRGLRGLGTALKPSHEDLVLAQKPLKDALSDLHPNHNPIVMARKPLSEKTVALNVLKWGVGCLNIDGCRVEHNEILQGGYGKAPTGYQKGVGTGADCSGTGSSKTTLGRFPANFIHDGSDEVLELFPMTKATKPHGGDGKTLDTRGQGWGFKRMPCELSDNGGSAARFFYCAKASKGERDLGCDGMELKHYLKENKMGGEGDTMLTGSGNPRDCRKRNNHPTVKPLALMEYLVKLISREGQTVLDPFMGSGTTGMACKKLNREFIGIEQSEEYLKIAEARIGAIECISK